MDGAGTSLWVVGNRAQRIYRLSLDGQVQLTLEGWVSGEYANRIPSFAHLDDEAIAAVLTYHGTHFGNQSRPANEAIVRAVRRDIDK